VKEIPMRDWNRPQARSRAIAICLMLSLAFIADLVRVPPAAAADLTIPTAGRVTIELIGSDATFSNTLAVTSPIVGIAATGCKLEAADGLTGVRILSEKQSQRGCRVDLDSDPGSAGIQGFAANTTFEFQLCAQTDADADCDFLWSSNPASNSDAFDHVRTTEISTGRAFQLAWEDISGGGDQDFNDLIAVVRVQSDADGDGLWDDWEQSGIDTDGNGTVDLDLPALGADPQRKDIFLEVDFMQCAVAGGDCAGGDGHSHGPKAAAVQATVDAFANAPVSNPDGSTGIDLHVDVDDAVPHQNFMSVGCGFGDTAYDAVKANPAFFGPANPRRFAYHYAIFGHRQDASTTSSGCAELPGNDHVVTLGEWNTACIGRGTNGTLDTTPAGDDVAVPGNFVYSGPNLTCNTTAAGDDVQFIANGGAPAADLDSDGVDDRTVGTIQQQAGTLMHEFGHNLNLQHGGNESANNFKPNYLSVMNYAFQMRGIAPTDPDGTGPLTARVDFSPADLPDLNENTLNEPAGIGDGTDNTRYTCPGGTTGIGVGSGPIDWNCDADGGADASVAVDINGNGAQAVLTGFDDWDNLKFDFQNTSDFEDGVHLTTTEVEIDQPTNLSIPEAVAIAITPAAINCDNSREVVIVALLTTPDFDASSVVLTTVTLEGASEMHVHSRTGQPERHASDVDVDGDIDLVFHFRLAATSLTCGSTTATLTGQTVDGQTIEGTDLIRMITR
jgi:hypothetical protein